MSLVKKDFFVPYVKNLCALHLLRIKLHDRIEEIEYQIEKVKKGEPEPSVSKPYYEDAWSVKRIIIIICAVIWGGIWSCAPNDIASSFVFFKFSMIATSLLIVGIAIYGAKTINDDNSTRAEAYEYELLAVKRIHDKNVKQRQEKLPALWHEEEECRAAYNETSRVLNEMYNANVIPGQYRNLHAVVYLYDWFSKSNEEDLGMALNTFVLEQIKDRLDAIIRNQGEMLLNQQMQLSLQMQSNEERAQHERMLESKLNRLEMAEDERSRNLDMIARTNSSVLWYAQQDYIRNTFM